MSRCRRPRSAGRCGVRLRGAHGPAALRTAHQDAAQRDPHFLASQTPRYVGRDVAALGSDPNVASKAGRVLTPWDLAEEYDLFDLDGSRPPGGRHYAAEVLHVEPDRPARLLQARRSRCRKPSWRTSPRSCSCWPMIS